MGSKCFVYCLHMKKALFLTLISVITSAASAQIYEIVNNKYPATYKGKKPVWISSSSTYYKPGPVFTNTKPGQTSTLRHEYTFDKAGMLASSSIYNAEGVLTDRQVFENDTIRKLVLKSIRHHYSSLPNMIDTITNTFDQQGFIIKQNITSGNAATIVEYTNDEKGFPVASRTSDGKGNFESSETAVYNHIKNYMIIKANWKDGKLLMQDTLKISLFKPYGSYKAKEKYNQQGDCISYRAKNRNGTYTNKEVEYEYDIEGNWINMKWYEIEEGSSGAKQRKLQAVYSRDIMYQ